MFNCIKRILCNNKMDLAKVETKVEANVEANVETKVREKADII